MAGAYTLLSSSAVPVSNDHPAVIAEIVIICCSGCVWQALAENLCTGEAQCVRNNGIVSGVMCVCEMCATTATGLVVA